MLVELLRKMVKIETSRIYGKSIEIDEYDEYCNKEELTIPCGTVDKTSSHSPSIARNRSELGRLFDISNSIFFLAISIFCLYCSPDVGL